MITPLQLPVAQFVLITPVQFFLCTVLALFSLGLVAVTQAQDKTVDSDNIEKTTAEAEDEHCTALCFVLLKEAKTPTREFIAKAIEEEFGVELDADEKDLEESDSGLDAWIFTYEGNRIILGYMPKPIPKDEASIFAGQNIFWPEGEKEAAKHQSHLIVSSMREDNDMIQASLATTRAAAAIAKASEAYGVYWGNGEISNATEFFCDNAEGSSPKQLPLMNWVRFQLVRTEEGTKLYTVGMDQFGKMEIETAPCNWPAKELFGFSFDIAHYLLTTDAEIKDGNTVGGTDDEKIKVFHLPSMLDEDRTVYQIQLPNRKD